METIHLKGIGFVAEDIKRKLKERKIRNVHFSIDVDSIDPRFAPGTGTRVCEGLMPDEFNNFVDHMLSTNLVIRNLNSMVYDKSVKRKSPCSG